MRGTTIEKLHEHDYKRLTTDEYTQENWDKMEFIILLSQVVQEATNKIRYCCYELFKYRIHKNDFLCICSGNNKTYYNITSYTKLEIAKLLFEYVD